MEEVMNIEGIQIREYGSVKEIAERLGCNLPSGIACIPRNFDSANSREELVYDDLVKTIRTLMREKGIEESKFEKEGERFKYVQENAFLEGMSFFVSLDVLAHNQYVIALALNIVANFITDAWKGAGRFKAEEHLCKLSFIVQQKNGQCSRVMYSGPVSGLAGIEKVICELQEKS